ncbi:MAG: D-glucuronyl C5-epimerase family protein [Solirubrobacterales bacterium]
MRFGSEHRLHGARLLALALLFTLVLAGALMHSAANAPSASAATSVDRALDRMAKKRQISKRSAKRAKKLYANARALRKKLGRKARSKKKRAQLRVRRRAMNAQIRQVESLARRGKLNSSRLTPVFGTLQQNTRWFKSNGARPNGTDRRFRGSRIIFQYFSGRGWQFHPLSNFSKLNAIWTVDDAPSRRAQRAFAKELIRWGAKRGNALVWEYYFPYAGSSAPFISSISQGSAIQGLARVAYRMNNKAIMRAAKRGLIPFNTPAPRGLRVKRDGGYHYLGYSGTKKQIILNMFVQSVNAVRDYALIADDKDGRVLYKKGLAAANKVTPHFDTGSWSLYSLRGPKSNLHYHRLTITFLTALCRSSKEDRICRTRDKFQRYLDKR